MAAGRVGRGERWQLRELTSEIAITHDGRPLYLNRTRIAPASQPLEQLGWMERCNYLGTIVMVALMRRTIGSGWRWNSIRRLQGIQGVQGSASAIARWGMCGALYHAQRRPSESERAEALGYRAEANWSGWRHFPCASSSHRKRLDRLAARKVSNCPRREQCEVV